MENKENFEPLCEGWWTGPESCDKCTMPECPNSMAYRIRQTIEETYKKCNSIGNCGTCNYNGISNDAIICSRQWVAEALMEKFDIKEKKG